MSKVKFWKQTSTKNKKEKHMGAVKSWSHKTGMYTLQASAIVLISYALLRLVEVIPLADKLMTTLACTIVGYVVVKSLSK